MDHYQNEKRKKVVHVKEERRDAGDFWVQEQNIVEFVAIFSCRSEKTFWVLVQVFGWIPFSPEESSSSSFIIKKKSSDKQKRIVKAQFFVLAIIACSVVLCLLYMGEIEEIGADVWYVSCFSYAHNFNFHI